MRTILILFFLFKTAAYISQEAYQQNLWIALHIRKNWNDKYWLTFDGGYRSFDHFIRDNRTILGRVVFEKFIDKKNSIGLGYAYFDHQQTNRIFENRYILHYRFIHKFKKADLSIRVRNEFRSYPWKRNTNNRIRAQINYQYNGIHPFFQPAIAFEMFYTSGDKKTENTEQRYQLSIISKWNSFFGSQIFYTLQNQSFIKEIQNIIGLQLNINVP
jgi:hypothetical protein